MIKIGNNSTGVNNGAISVTISHTVGNNPDRILIVAVQARDVNATKRTVSGITFNGVALTRINFQVEGSNRLELWRLLNPDVGTYNVVVTMALGTPASLSAGVTDIYDAMVQATENNTPNSVATDTITTNVSNISGQALIYSAVLGEATTPGISHGTGQTELYSVANNAQVGEASYKFAATAGSQSMQETQTGTARMIQIVAAFTSKHHPNVFDASTILENVSLSKPNLYLSVFENTINISEVTYQYLTELNVNVYDIATIEEFTYLYLTELFASGFDGIIINESISVIDLVVEVGIVAESIAIAEVNSLYLDALFLNAYEDVSVLENISLYLDVLYISVVENASVEEFVYAYLDVLNLSISDTSSIEEFQYLFLSELFVSVEEAISVSEVIEVVDLVVELGIVYETLTAEEALSIYIDSLFVAVYDEAAISEFSNQYLTVLNVDVFDTLSVAENFDIFIPELNISVMENYVYLSEQATQGVTPIPLFAMDEEYVYINEVVSILDITIELGWVVEYNYVAEYVSLYLDSLFVSVNDNPTVQEVVNVRIPILYITNSETISVAEFAEVLLPELYASVSDSVAVSEWEDIYLDVLNVESNDNISVLEAIEMSIDALYVDTYESIGVEEVSQVSLPYLSVDIFDSVSTEEVIELIDLVIELAAAEDIGVAESFELYLGELFIDRNDDVVVVDRAWVTDLVIECEGSDYVVVNENLGILIPELNLSVASDVAVACQASIGLPSLLFDVYEDISVVEDINILIPEYFVSVFELVGVVEDLAVVVGELFIAEFEAVSVAEAATVTDLVIEVEGHDFVAVSEEFTALMGEIYIAAEESVAIAESFEILLPLYNVQAIDNVNVIESLILYLSGIGSDVVDLIFIEEAVAAYLDSLFVDVTENIAVQEHISMTDIVIELEAAETIAVSEYSEVFEPYYYIDVYEQTTVEEYINMWDIVIELFVFDGVSAADIIITESGFIDIIDDVGVSGGALIDWLWVSESASVVLPILNINVGEAVIGIQEHINMLDLIIEIDNLVDVISVSDSASVYSPIDLYAYEVLGIEEYNITGFPIMIPFLVENIDVDDVLAIAVLSWDLWPRIYEVSPRVRFFTKNKMKVRGDTMRIPTVNKQPSETFSIGLKYVSPDLEEGGRILSGITSVRPSEAGGVVTIGNVVVENDMISQLISGGVDGHDYFVSFKVVTSGGHTYEDEIFVKVREL